MNESTATSRELTSKANNITNLSYINKYADLEKYCLEQEILYKKACTVYEGYVVEIDYLAKEGIKDIITAVAAFERNNTVAEQLIQNLFAATNTYGKPFEITIRVYLETLKAYPIECLKQILDPRKYANFPCLADVLKSIKQEFPLIEAVINPDSNIYKHE